MINILVLSLIVILSTAIWPVNRWALHKGASAEGIGTCLSAIALAGVLLVATMQRKAFYSAVAILSGGGAGAAYAIGYVLIILHCLKIGPVGPTVTLNNLGLIGPVLTSLIWFSDGKILSPVTLGGIIATIGALIMMGWVRLDHGGNRRVTRRWLTLALVGWAFSCISMTCQFLCSRYAPRFALVHVASMYAVSLVILLLVQVARNRVLPGKEEVVAGVFSGVAFAVYLPMMVWILTRVEATSVYSIAVAGPAVLALLIGHLVFKERLNHIGWAASCLGIIGIIFLSVR